MLWDHVHLRESTSNKLQRCSPSTSSNSNSNNGDSSTVSSLSTAAGPLHLQMHLQHTSSFRQFPQQEPPKTLVVSRSLCNLQTVENADESVPIEPMPTPMDICSPPLLPEPVAASNSTDHNTGPTRPPKCIMAPPLVSYAMWHRDEHQPAHVLPTPPLSSTSAHDLMPSVSGITVAGNAACFSIPQEPAVSSTDWLHSHSPHPHSMFAAPRLCSAPPLSSHAAASVLTKQFECPSDPYAGGPAPTLALNASAFEKEMEIHTSAETVCGSKLDCAFEEEREQPTGATNTVSPASAFAIGVSCEGACGGGGSSATMILPPSTCLLCTQPVAPQPLAHICDHLAHSHALRQISDAPAAPIVQTVPSQSPSLTEPFAFI